MKKILAICLVLALLVPLCLVNLTVEAEKTAVKPFYGVSWGGVDRNRYPNLTGMPSVYIYPETPTDEDPAYFIYGSYSSKDHGMASIAQAVKESMNALPEGMRYMQFLHPVRIFGVYAESAVYLDEGVAILKSLVTEFMENYKAIGGKMDGVIMDLEYQNIQNWYIFTRFYQEGQTSIYNDLVAHPLYQTKVRPMLVERGFKFWPNPSGERSELWSIYPYAGDAYAESRAIWDNVMRVCLAEYLNEAIWEPQQEYFPGTHMSDYQTTDGYGWQKKQSSEGGNSYLGGNVVKAGNTSNLNTYFVQPTANYYEINGTMQYLAPVSYNEAVFDADSYAMFLWDMNRLKQMYEATDTGRVNIWISEFDSNLDTYENRVSTSSNNAYYSEMILHTGLMNPDVFLLYFAREHREDLTDEEFADRYQVVADCLDELTRVVGAADREPIYVPYNWNDGYVLSGMYAGGRNMWRITPDTTDGMTVEDFKVKDQAPTFYINGKTIVFPQGRIVEDGEIFMAGTAGYWVETPADVTPVVIADADRFSANPSYGENFDRYTASTAFTADTAKEKDAWTVSGSAATVIANGGSNVLSMTGTTTISNVTLPGKITAGDDYAMQQAWEVSFTLPATLTSGSVKLLTCGTDSGFTVSGSSLSYDKNGTATQFSGLTLTAGVKYTVRREINFNNKTCTYVVLANGEQVAKAENIAMKSVALPVETISFKTSNLGSQSIYLDDYKLYPIGLTAGFEVYNAETGIELADATVASAGNVAYRLSWLNNSGAAKKATVVAEYYNNGVLASTETVNEIVMAAGNDGVATAIVENKEGMTVKLVLQTADTTVEETPDYDDGDFDWPRYEDNVVQPEDTITSSSPVIYMENTRAITGQELKVTVSLKNNPGVAYVKMNVSYDRTKLELVSAENAGLLSDFTGSDVTAYPYAMTWGNTESLADVTGDGAVAVLTFRVLAEDASETDITIACSRRDAYNANNEYIDFIPVRNTVSIQDYISGDLNGDGLVNMKDAALLRRYVAKWPNVVINLDAADVNADNVINMKDAALLLRFVSGWPGIELK